MSKDLPTIESEPESTSSMDSELDVTSEKFDPLRALYEPGFVITKRQPKVIYQNIAALESAYKRVGILDLDKPAAKLTNKNKKAVDSGTNPSCSKQPTMNTEEGEQRRFQPHQMPIKGSRRKVKDMHNIFTYLDGVTGPMASLKQSIGEQHRVRVLIRTKSGIRGSVEGTLICFDKFWNLWLRNIKETWRRRKYKYGVNKMCGEPADCTERLRALGIELPRQQVKSINRKTVEISRELKQLFVRGEQVALVNILPHGIEISKPSTLKTSRN
ncbi:U7 snRNA-associated Sm-like protein LSm11 [Anastrepha obliqua]|uniref:U7 snRNA-associated Sm-like protein LSm11 n=1 Tax=Anastrepha obliqua TaxID=95512 RepID=UPI0024098174|nr:U7 snRNA-associated Sm-like protein LSm11 [Anastrepha obliqua]